MVTFFPRLVLFKKKMLLITFGFFYFAFRNMITSGATGEENDTVYEDAAYDLEW